MTMGAAAEAAGVSPGTVRRWRKEGTIAERKAPGDRGGVEVFLTADCRQAESVERDTTTAASQNSGPHSELGVLVPLEIHQRSLAELILRLTDTTERAVRAEARAEMLEAQLGELRSSATQPTGTLPSPPPRRRKQV
jgi:DNA-binding transcriptional MerR regulator